MDGSKNGINRKYIARYYIYIPGYINNQAKCKWSKYKTQKAELVRLDKQVLHNCIPSTKK